MIDIQEKKEHILSFLRTNGPSLPVRIAKSIEMQPVLASAVLSEILSEKRVKMSHLKIGTSSLYLLPGQEPQLENFTDSLKAGEKEAFLRIKEKKVLYDAQEEPQIRVALRSIRDFALPFKHQEQILWRYAFTPEEDIKSLILKKQPEKRVFEEKKESKEEPSKNPSKEKNEEKQSLPEKKEKEVEPIFDTEEQEKPAFFTEVLDFLKGKDIEFLEEIQTEKKEIVGKVRISSTLGTIDFLLVAKNKKSLTKEEVTSSIQRATYQKMPCLVLIRKKPTKAVSTLIEENNLIKILVMR